MSELSCLIGCFIRTEFQWKFSYKFFISGLSVTRFLILQILSAVILFSSGFCWADTDEIGDDAISANHGSPLSPFGDEEFGRSDWRHPAGYGAPAAQPAPVRTDCLLGGDPCPPKARAPAYASQAPSPLIPTDKMSPGEQGSFFSKCGRGTIYLDDPCYIEWKGQVDFNSRVAAPAVGGVEAAYGAVSAIAGFARGRDGREPPPSGVMPDPARNYALSHRPPRDPNIGVHWDPVVGAMVRSEPRNYPCRVGLDSKPVDDQHCILPITTSSQPPPHRREEPRFTYTKECQDSFRDPNTGALNVPFGQCRGLIGEGYTTGREQILSQRQMEKGIDLGRLQAAVERDNRRRAAREARRARTPANGDD